GIAFAQASLLRGECTTGIYESDVEPKYHVTVSYVSGGVTSEGCPSDGASAVYFTSTGEASSPGTGNIFGDVAKVQASFVATGSGVPPSGAAIYAYSAIGFGGSGSLTSSDGSDATVHIRNGSVTCNGGSSV